MLYWDHVYGSGNKGGICVITFITFLIIILLGYILISHFILKRKLHIKEIRLHIFSKNRNKLLLKIEIILLIGFLVSSLIFINMFVDHDYYPFIPGFIFLFLILVECITFVELWLYHREERAYYYSLSAAIMYLLIFISTFFINDFS